MYGSSMSQSSKDLNLPYIQQMSPSSVRFRSAPSSVMGEVCEDLLPIQSLSPEADTEGMFGIRNKASDGGGFCYSASGLFAHLNSDNGYGMMRGHHAHRLKSQLSYSSRQNSVMSQISELGSEGIDGCSPDNSTDQSYVSRISTAPWDNSSSVMTDNHLLGFKRERKMVSGLNLSETQNGGMRSHVSQLSHQFSAPKTSSEMHTIEKLLQFQDAVPCKIRAKRGCATHPRSIAERVRRTRISERMKKLQELVPNMDKQTNTSDMLDLAVDYIKDLQKQVKMLADSRTSCFCSAAKLKSFSNQ